MYQWLVGFFPQHQKYIEPFGGGGSVLMQKARSYAEVYNDLDEDVVNVFRVLRDPDLAKELQFACQLTPFARSEYEIAQDDSSTDPVERARRTLFRATAGFGSAAATKCRSGFRSDSNREWSLAGHVWQKYPSNIRSFCERLQGVVIENRPAREVIEQHATVDSLTYLDPPYLPETRVMNGHRYYRHEMTCDEHEQLLAEIQKVPGYVLISGYDSELYNDMLKGWHKHQRFARAAAQKGTKVAVECVWLNPMTSDRIGQPSLFGGAG